jgi:hypothetical protein
MSDRVLSLDEISAMTDEDLSRRISSLTGYLGRERNRGNRHLELELEFCYLYRESEVRERRQAAHLEWLTNGGHLSNIDEEYFN